MLLKSKGKVIIVFSSFILLLISFLYFIGFNSDHFDIPGNQVIGSHKTLNFCPVTSDEHFVSQSNGYYHYPIQLYKPAKKIKSVPSLPCSEQDNILKNVPKPVLLIVNRTCPVKPVVCPIKKQNFDQFIKTSKPWVDPLYFSQFYKQMNNKSAVLNVIVFGNSVSVGLATHGCCANKVKCAVTTVNDWSPKDPGFNCGFGNYISRWFSHNSHAKINYYNKAWPGYSSKTTSQTFLDLIVDRNLSISPFTSNDLILLDHSIADFKLPIDELYQVMTTFINKLYAYSASSSDLPLLVLLDMEPRTNNEYKTYEVNKVYSKIAELYEIPLWSYRNAVNQGYTDRQVASEKFIDYLRLNKRKSKRLDFHPPWHVHMYYAELVVSALQYYFQKVSHVVSSGSGCDCISGGDSNSISNRSRNNDISNNLGDHCECDVDGLSEPKGNLSNVFNVYKHTRLAKLQHIFATTGSKEPVCDTSKPVLLQLSYDALVNNKTVIGSYSSSGWNLALDMKNRGGFIQQLDEKSSLNDSRSNITFHLIGIKKDHHHDTTTRYMFSLNYLASYTNMGVVDIYLCGHFVTTIDALWVNYNTNKVSLAQIYNMVFTERDCIDGFNNTNNRNSFDSNYNSNSSSKSLYSNVSSIRVGSGNTGGTTSNIIAGDREKMTVRIVYRIQNWNNNNSSHMISISQLMQLQPRLKQMFKIASVKVCQVL